MINDADDNIDEQEAIKEYQDFLNEEEEILEEYGIKTKDTNKTDENLLDIVKGIKDIKEVNSQVNDIWHQIKYISAAM